MKKFWILAVFCSFVAGSILSGNSIFADPGEKGNPFDRLQKQIDDIINGNTSINGNSKILSLGSGIGGFDEISYACRDLISDFPLTSCSQNVPIGGKMFNLVGSSIVDGTFRSPGEGSSYEVTVVKNGLDTSLSCIISDEETKCQNYDDEVLVVAGDVIDLKITSNGDPKFANIAGSVLLKP